MPICFKRGMKFLTLLFADRSIAWDSRPRSNQTSPSFRIAIEKRGINGPKLMNIGLWMIGNVLYSPMKQKSTSGDQMDASFFGLGQMTLLRLIILMSQSSTVEAR